MTIKNRDIEGILLGIQKLAVGKMDIQNAYKFIDISNKLKVPMENYYALFDAVIKEYGELDKNGEIVSENKDGKTFYKFREDIDTAEVEEKLAEIDDMEVVIDFEPIFIDTVQSMCDLETMQNLFPIFVQ